MSPSLCHRNDLFLWLLAKLPFTGLVCLSIWFSQSSFIFYLSYCCFLSLSPAFQLLLSSPSPRTAGTVPALIPSLIPSSRGIPSPRHHSRQGRHTLPPQPRISIHWAVHKPLTSLLADEGPSAGLTLPPVPRQGCGPSSL